MCSSWKRGRTFSGVQKNIKKKVSLKIILPSIQIGAHSICTLKTSNIIFFIYSLGNKGFEIIGKRHSHGQKRVQCSISTYCDRL